MFNLKPKNIPDIPDLEFIDQNIIPNSELAVVTTVPKTNKLSKSKLSTLGNSLGNNLRNTITSLSPFKSKLEREIIREQRLLRKQELEDTKEYLFHYNRQLAKAQEKLVMSSVFENNREVKF